MNRGGESKQGGDRRRRDLFEGGGSNQGEEAPSCHTAAAAEGEKTDIEQREREVNVFSNFNPFAL